jgi:hypothetical protein
MKAVPKVGLVVLTLLAESALAQTGLSSFLRDPSVMVGGGVEGYTQALAPQIDIGVTYGVAVGLQPTRLLGLELGYSGAVNGIDLSRHGAGIDRELVRNGAYAAATVSPFSSAVRPYVMGGLGFSSYNVRGGAAGLRDNVVGNVPLGVGVRTSPGAFIADARLSYNVLFDEEFAVGAPVPRSRTGGPSDLSISGSGRYSGTLNLGLMW